MSTGKDRALRQMEIGFEKVYDDLLNDIIKAAGELRYFYEYELDNIEFIHFRVRLIARLINDNFKVTYTDGKDELDMNLDNIDDLNVTITISWLD